MPEHHELTIDMAGPDTLTLTLDGTATYVPVMGHVDNLLLTAVDKLLQEHRIHKSAHVTVHTGAGVDKNSSLYRMVQSFAAAVAAGA